MLIRLNSVDEYKMNIDEVRSSFYDIHPYYVAGATVEIQKGVENILDKKLRPMHSLGETVKIIRYVISKIAGLCPKKINNHIFIGRLSRNFELERYIGDIKTIKEETTLYIVVHSGLIDYEMADLHKFINT